MIERIKLETLRMQVSEGKRRWGWVISDLLQSRSFPDPDFQLPHTADMTFLIYGFIEEWEENMIIIPWELKGNRMTHCLIFWRQMVHFLRLFYMSIDHMCPHVTQNRHRWFPWQMFKLLRWWVTLFLFLNPSSFPSHLEVYMGKKRTAYICPCNVVHQFSAFWNITLTRLPSMWIGSLLSLLE